MFSLAYPITKSVEIEGVKYPLDVSFDNILRLIDMLGMKNCPMLYRSRQDSSC